MAYLKYKDPFSELSPYGVRALKARRRVVFYFPNNQTSLEVRLTNGLMADR